MPESGLQQKIKEKTGLYLSDGSVYGKGGEMFLRMNLGCSRQTLNEGLKRLTDFFDVYYGI
jgi:cystathionine beta-lyase